MTAHTIRAAAPLRISFVGGGTDFPHYYERHGGAVLSATIDHGAHVDVTPRSDRQVRIRSLDLGHIVEYHLERGPEYDGVMDLPKAAIARFGVDGGLDVAIRSDAPPGSGLGGSSALVTACVGALALLADRSLSPGEVARLAYAIEREDLGIAGGWQDQYAAAFGGFNLIEFSETGTTVTPLDLIDEALAELRRHLLLCYTGHVRTDLGLDRRPDPDVRGGPRGDDRGDEAAARDGVRDAQRDRRRALRGARRAARRGVREQEAHEPAYRRGHPDRVAVRGGEVCGRVGREDLRRGRRRVPPARVRTRSAVGGPPGPRDRGGQIAGFSFRDRGVEAARGDRTWSPA